MFILFSMSELGSEILYMISEFLPYIIVASIIAFLLPFFVLYPGIYYGRFRTKGPTFPMETFDGAKIEGLMLEPHDPKKCNITFVYLYGESGNMNSNLGAMQQINSNLNCYVLSLDYRGFGGSYGFPSENGIINDIETLLRMIYDDEKFENTKVILYGRSVGGCGILGLINKLVGSDEPNDKKLYDMVSGIILEDVFVDAKTYINKRFSNITKYIPEFILDIILYPNTWKNDININNINKDVLFLVGENSNYIGDMELLYNVKSKNYRKLAKYETLDYYEYIRKFVEIYLDE